MAAIRGRKNISGQQDGSPDLLSELVDPKDVLLIEGVKFIDLCLGVNVSDEDFNAAVADLSLTDEQRLKIAEVLKGSDYDLAGLAAQTDDAEIAFLLLRLILGCVF